MQGPTSSRRQLESALSQLKIPPRDTTLIYSAIKNSSEDWMKEVPGRKAFMLLTDGVAYKEPTSITTAIEFAQRADTIIYPIRFSDPEPFSRPVIGLILAMASEHGKQGMLRMARETGGAYSKSRRASPLRTSIRRSRRRFAISTVSGHAGASRIGWKVSQDQTDHEGSPSDRQRKSRILCQLRNEARDRLTLPDICRTTKSTMMCLPNKYSNKVSNTGVLAERSIR